MTRTTEKTQQTNGQRTANGVHTAKDAVVALKAIPFLNHAEAQANYFDFVERWLLAYGKNKHVDNIAAVNLLLEMCFLYQKQPDLISPAAWEKHVAVLKAYQESLVSHQKISAPPTDGTRTQRLLDTIQKTAESSEPAAGENHVNPHAWLLERLSVMHLFRNETHNEAYRAFQKMAEPLLKLEEALIRNDIPKDQLRLRINLINALIAYRSSLAYDLIITQENNYNTLALTSHCQTLVNQIIEQAPPGLREQISSLQKEFMPEKEPQGSARRLSTSSETTQQYYEFLTVSTDSSIIDHQELPSMLDITTEKQRVATERKNALRLNAKELLKKPYLDQAFKNFIEDVFITNLDHYDAPTLLQIIDEMTKGIYLCPEPPAGIILMQDTAQKRQKSIQELRDAFFKLKKDLFVPGYPMPVGVPHQFGLARDRFLGICAMNGSSEAYRIADARMHHLTELRAALLSKHYEHMDKVSREHRTNLYQQLLYLQILLHMDVKKYNDNPPATLISRMSLHSVDAGSSSRHPTASTKTLEDMGVLLEQYCEYFTILVQSQLDPAFAAKQDQHELLDLKQSILSNPYYPIISDKTFDHSKQIILKATFYAFCTALFTSLVLITLFASPDVGLGMRHFVEWFAEHNHGYGMGFAGTTLKNVFNFDLTLVLGTTVAAAAVSTAVLRFQPQKQPIPEHLNIKPGVYRGTEVLNNQQVSRAIAAQAPSP